MASINDKLEHVRKPRVHIKYEVETEGGIVEKELPFVVGVMGDYSGNNPGEALKPIKDRKFTHIDRDNFNDVLAKQKPGLQFKIKNTLQPQGENSELSIDLQFNALEDFEPTQIVEKIPALKALKTRRDQLRDLLSKSDRSINLERILEETLQDPDKFTQLASELGLKTNAGDN